MVFVLFLLACPPSPLFASFLALALVGIGTTAADIMVVHVRPEEVDKGLA